jgi:alkanesulfonate monooxygenase SsuD/methylene tetrahydromethanopterin reductase-like flavin-dependent oxidoreductase (luciferase family)
MISEIRKWRQPADRLYREILHQISWGEDNGFDDVWLSEHHFIDDGYHSHLMAPQSLDRQAGL